MPLNLSRIKKNWIIIAVFICLFYTAALIRRFSPKFQSSPSVFATFDRQVHKIGNVTSFPVRCIIDSATYIFVSPPSGISRMRETRKSNVPKERAINSSGEHFLNAETELPSRIGSYRESDKNGTRRKPVENKLATFGMPKNPKFSPSQVHEPVREGCSETAGQNGPL